MKRAAAMALAAVLTAAAPPPPPPHLAVFLLMGQSNMSGRGDPAELPPGFPRHGPRLFVYGNDARWRPAREPLDAAKGQIDAVSADGQAGVGPGLAFADRLAALRPKLRIGLVPCAKGGTAIAQWSPARSRRTLYGSCLARAREASAQGHIAGALWYQGESDARSATAARGWTAAFTRLAARLRADLTDPALPIVLVLLADPPRAAGFEARYPLWRELCTAQSAIALPGLAHASAARLPLADDQLHLTTASQLTLGRRIAKARDSLLAAQP